MDYFPMFMNLQGRTALVVGGTEAAAQKARLLLRAGSNLEVVAENIGPEMEALIDEPLVMVFRRPFAPKDLDGVTLAIASSEDEDENTLVSRSAQARGLPVNVVDQPTLCSFIMPAFIDRSPVMVAVSSGGASPVLARLIRARIEALLPQKLGSFAALAQAFRQQVMQRLPAAVRRRFWEDALEGEPADHAFRGDIEAASDLLQSQIETEACQADIPCKMICRHPECCLSKRKGEVWLVGAGPGDPDLLTNKALRLMQRCDVVLHDRLVPDAILDRIRRDAEIIPVGKAPGGKGWPQDAINTLMVERAKAGDRVLRLKCGDPMIFGRGGEERDALRAAGIPVTVVPGITAGLAAASEAGVALTDRRLARHCIVTHGSALIAMSRDELDVLDRNGTTILVYMARPWLDHIRHHLLDAGFSKDMPALLTTAASRQDAEWSLTSLDKLGASSAEGDQPVLLIIGDNAAAADNAALHPSSITSTMARQQAALRSNSLLEEGA